jgi:hypothetical protein
VAQDDKSGREAGQHRVQDRGEARQAARKVEAAAVLGQDYRPNPTVPEAPTFAKIAVEQRSYNPVSSANTKENHAIFLKNHPSGVR